MASRHGLQWVGTLWGVEPRWTVEPDVSAMPELVKQHLPSAENTEVSVTFLTQGGFNKLYRIEDGTKACVLRVALPVDPHRKTASEVATMEFVRSKSEAPVPGVIAHDHTNDNPLGFEWILMEHMPGQPFHDKRKHITVDQKEALVKQLALYQSQLYQHQWDKIGNVYHQDGTNGDKVGPIVSMSFFWGDRGMREVTRGPFRNSHEWLSCRLELVIEDQANIVKTSDDEDAVEDAEKARQIAAGLQEILPGIFPPDDIEATTLFHDDVNQHNLLVSDDGDLTAFLDWECVSALPLWRACQLPALLHGRVRDELPKREEYQAYDLENDEGDPAQYDGMCSLYWEHLLEYEQSQLRPVFLAEMKRLQPEWMRHYEEGELRRDFELAVLYCDGELTMKSVRLWIEAYKRGEPESLVEALS